MEQPTDPRGTGTLPAAGKIRPDTISPTPGAVPPDSRGRLIFASTTTRMPVVIAPDRKKQKKQSAEIPARLLALPLLTKWKKFAKPDKRLTGYIVSGVGLLTLILGFVFSVPLNNGQREPTTLAQGIANLIINGQNGSMASQAQGGGQSSAQTNSTPGYPNAGGSRFFSNSSPWNMPIGTNVQLDPDSEAMVNELSGCCHVPAIFSFGMPIYTSTASDPLYTVQDNDRTFEAYQPIHIPDDAAPSPGSDKWLFIYDRTKNLLFEMWQASKDGGTWSANTGDVYSSTGDGVLQVDGTPQSGNGASYFGGVVTDADIARGYINHALSFASQFSGSSFRYPMVASDGGGGDVPMGARIQLDPAVNCNALPGASTGEKMVCQALETYGGYMRDTGGVALSMYFEGEDLGDASRNPPDGSPGNAGRSGGIFGRTGLQDGRDLSAIPWNRLRVLRSWNSFTALGNSSAPASPIAATNAPHPLSTPIAMALTLLDTQLTLADESARLRLWPSSSQHIPSSLVRPGSTSFPPLRDRLLLLRRLQH